MFIYTGTESRQMFHQCSELSFIQASTGSAQRLSQYHELKFVQASTQSTQYAGAMHKNWTRSEAEGNMPYFY